MIRRPTVSTLFPYTTLFRSANVTASRVSRERTRKLRIFQPTGYFSLDLAQGSGDFFRLRPGWQGIGATTLEQDRKSTRLNSSHTVISYAVFCLKKKY